MTTLDQLNIAVYGTDVDFILQASSNKLFTRFTKQARFVSEHSMDIQDKLGPTAYLFLCVGSLCQVGLRQKIVEVPQDRLAYDFEIGDAILYNKSPSSSLRGKVERTDSSRWYASYFLLGQEWVISV